MSRREVWKRLLWKELREDRWPLAVAFVAMTTLHLLVGAYANTGGFHQSWMAQALALVAAGSAHLAIAIWGATKGDSKRGSTEFEFTHLPASPLLRWAASAVVPTLASAVLGLWFGFIMGSATWMRSEAPMPIVGALDLALTYAVTYFAASMVSLWAGILVGAAQVAGGTLLPVWQSDVIADAYTLLFAVRTLVAALVGTLMLAWLYRKASPAAQKGAALGLAVLIVYGPVVVQAWQVVARDPAGLRGLLNRTHVVTPTYEAFRASPLGTPDRAIVVEPRPTSLADIEVRDYLRQLARTISPEPFVEVIGVLRDGRVFLAQQLPYQRTVRVIEWDYVSNSTRTLARFSTKPFAMLREGEPGKSMWRTISPDGRYVIFELAGLFGGVNDVWVVDVETGRSSVALMKKGGGYRSVGWTDKRVLFGSEDGAYQIDLRTLRGRPFTVANALEGCR